MKRLQWYLIVTISFVGFSFFTYLTQIKIFNRSEETYFYLLQDLAFLPVQVLLVTIFVSEWLNRRQKQLMLNKMNMVIGTFFSEVGTSLIRTLTFYDSRTKEICKVVEANKKLSSNEFKNIKNFISGYRDDLNIECRDLQPLKDFLLEKRPFLLRLLENPNLLEHDTFTDLLWAVFHLTDELVQRKDLRNLPSADHAHILVDMKRVYVLLITEWLCYIKHLKVSYPYIFSLVMRTNPFNKNASAEISE